MAGASSPTSSSSTVPPSASRKMPEPRRDRAGERAALVAEELRLDERLGDRAAVDDEERLVAPVARLVDRARDALLAGAALARDEHRGPGAGDALRQLEDAAHRLGAEDDLAPAARARACARSVSFSATMARFSRAFWTSARSSLVGERLRDEVVGAALHRVDGRLDAAVRGHHDDLGARRPLLDERQEIEPAAVGHQQVGEHDGVRLGRVHHRVAPGREARARASRRTPRGGTGSRACRAAPARRRRRGCAASGQWPSSSEGYAPSSALSRIDGRSVAAWRPRLGLAGAHRDRDRLGQALVGVDELHGVRAGLDRDVHLRGASERLPVEEARRRRESS